MAVHGRGAGAGGSRRWTGVGLFLLGVAVGAIAVAAYLGSRDSARRRSGDSSILGSGGEAGGSARASVRDGASPRRGQRRHAAGAGPPGPLAGERRATATAGTAGRDQGGAGGEEGRGTGRAPDLGTGPQAATREPAQTRIALVIDDLGRRLDELEDLRRLGVPITYAVLPFENQTLEVVTALRRRHEEILCHLPMEPKSGGNPGPGALRAGMSRDQLRQSTLAAIAAVPGAVGVNNHMGSSLSADAASMSTILGVIASQGLFFLDSRTSAQSVGYRVATTLGVPAAERQVFLDDDPRPEAIAAQFQRLLEVARTRGDAIAIGHPHPATLATLAAEVPRARTQGFRFVQVSALLDRPAVQPLPNGR